MSHFSPNDLIAEFGVRRYGAEFAKAMTPVTAAPGRGGWSSLVVEEPFTGAWQRNMELRIESTLTYPTLYACLDRISSDIGKLPYVLKREDEDGRWVEDRGNTAYTPVLRKPNRYQTAQQFREAWLLSKLIQGNTYVLKGRDSRGVVDRLWILDPCRVLPMVSESGDVFYQLNYGIAENLLPQSYPAEQLIVPESEVIHDRMNCFHHQLIGVPPLCAANWAAVKNLKILQDSTTFFSNGANPGGILTAPAGMTEEDAQAVKEYWNSGFKGSNSGKVAVIGADMKFTPFAFKSADNQLVEQMQYSDQQITQPFGIPPFKVGIGTIPAGLKVSELNQLYYADALQRHIEAMENLLDEGLGIKRPQGVELDLEPLLRMDETAQSAVEVSLVSGEIKTTNEARKRFNLPPLEGGDTIYKQQQDFPLSEIANNTLASNEPAPVAADPVVQDTPTDDQLRALSQENFKLKALAAARAEVFAHD